MKRADEVEVEEVNSSVQKREKEDMERFNSVRNVFYKLNERFDQLLKFKPIRSVNIWSTDMNLESAYEMFASFKLEEMTESFEDKVKLLEA